MTKTSLNLVSLPEDYIIQKVYIWATELKKTDNLIDNRKSLVNSLVNYLYLVSWDMLKCLQHCEGIKVLFPLLCFFRNQVVTSSKHHNCNHCIFIVNSPVNFNPLPIFYTVYIPQCNTVSGESLKQLIEKFFKRLL